MLLCVIIKLHSLQQETIFNQNYRIFNIKINNSKAKYNNIWSTLEKQTVFCPNEPHIADIVSSTYHCQLQWRRTRAARGSRSQAPVPHRCARWAHGSRRHLTGPRGCSGSDHSPHSLGLSHSPANIQDNCCYHAYK